MPSHLTRRREKPVEHAETERTSHLQLERERIITSLRDLIAAIDRRLPRRDKGAERPIARDAATLRRKALRRLEELQEPPGESR